MIRSGPAHHNLWQDLLLSPQNSSKSTTLLQKKIQKLVLSHKYQKMLDFVDNDCLKENIVFILLLRSVGFYSFVGCRTHVTWLLYLLPTVVCLFHVFIFFEKYRPWLWTVLFLLFQLLHFLIYIVWAFLGGNGFSGIRSSSFTALILFRKVSFKLADFLPLEVGVFSMFNRQWEGVWTKLFESSSFWFGTNGNRIDLTSQYSV